MKQYIVDAFTDTLFSGNQAAVCVMDEWIPDELMQNIAIENNLSETAFAVKEGRSYQLRWFTPAGEIDFCGHATLGTSFVLFNYYCKDADVIEFKAQIGDLYVRKNGELFEMDFPAYGCRPVEITDLMEDAIGIRPIEAYMDRDLMLVVSDEEAVRKLEVDQEKLRQLEGVCIAVTAAGKEYDSVSRVFAPELNIPEDPVTGSTHCMIAPYWADRLDKEELICYQASERTGVLYAHVSGDRVKISGKAVLYSTSELEV